VIDVAVALQASFFQMIVNGVKSITDIKLVSRSAWNITASILVVKRYRGGGICRMASRRLLPDGEQTGSDIAEARLERGFPNLISID
jgi:hypothetical protein